MPLLRAEQGTSRAVAGLHGTMLAVGALIAAWVQVTATRRFGRRAVVVGGAVLLVAGVLLLVSGGGVVTTMLGALVAGTGGSSALNAASPALAAHHGEAGAAAISEANAVAAAVGIAAPLAVGAAVAAGLGWRPGIVVAVPLALVSIVWLLRLPPEPALARQAPPEPGGPRLPLGVPFWALCGVLTLGVGVEFATTFWAGDLLASRLGVAPGTAAAGVTAFVAGMAVGRAVGGSLALRIAAERLITGAILLAVTGWAVLWLAPSVPVALLGLVVAGLGVAVHFPLSISLLMRASDGRSDTAAAFASLGGGLAIGTAPFALGALADAFGTHRGFLLVPVLLLTALGLLLIATRRTP